MRLSFPLVLSVTLLIILLAQESLLASSYAPLPVGNGWDGDYNSALELRCAADPKEVKSGETFTMNVTLCNLAPKPMTSVFLEVDFDANVEPMAATMMPSEAWIWKFEEMCAGSCASLALKVRVPKPQRSFTMSRSISGEGYVSLSEDFSTKEEPYEIGCDVSAWTGGMNEPVRNSTIVAVLGEPGTEVSVREMGSGNYTSQEEVRFDSEDKSIEVARNFTNQSQRNASVLDQWSYIKLDENGTVLISGER